MKRAIIVHCWDGYPEYCWYPYVKKELEAKDFEVQIPSFPETDKPKLSKWLLMLKEKVNVPDENLYLIGHSVGCITILRYLETIGEDDIVGGVFFVAGFTNDLGFEELENFFVTPINFKTIKYKSKHGFFALHSLNDPYVDSQQVYVFKKESGQEYQYLLTMDIFLVKLKMRSHVRNFHWLLKS